MSHTGWHTVEGFRLADEVTAVLNIANVLQPGVSSNSANLCSLLVHSSGKDGSDGPHPATASDDWTTDIP
jgi:hypothetical protein